MTMTMDSAAASVLLPRPLDLDTLRARVDQRIVLLRTWLSHDHGDEPYWWARRTTAPRTQSERQTLRALANLLHVERATARGRIHGTRFASLDDQRAWLAATSSIAARPPRATPACRATRRWSSSAPASCRYDLGCTRGETASRAE
jgi:hypothetical protein